MAVPHELTMVVVVGQIVLLLRSYQFRNYET
jgi:hypothetical protein